jgi:hypothetical protein
MKKIVRVGLDFHGAVFDHRFAKYIFFRDVLGLDYENPLFERKEIVSVLSRKYNVDEAHYKKQLDIFLDHPQALNGHFVTGFKEFLEQAPKNWEFVILRGTPQGATNVNRLLHLFSLNRIVGSFCTAREMKPEILKNIEAKVYFDDRDDLFKEVKEAGVITVQINRPVNVVASSIADYVFDDWHCAIDELDEIISNIKKRQLCLI